ncbi:hypothetical protein ACOMHN_062573 [Nucella lapillus]
MGPAVFFCVILCLIQSSTQYSVGKLSHDRMVSDGWSDDILTDQWNGVPRGCDGKPADVYFVLDTASGASPAALSRQKSYLSDLAAIFPMQDGRARVGIMTYGFAPFITAPLGRAATVSQLQEALRNTLRVGGSRRTAQALKYLRRTAFSPSVARQEVAHVVILLTNGYSADAKHTAQEAAALRKKGVIVYTMSIEASGPVDKGEQLAIASEPTEEFSFHDDDGWKIVTSLMEVLHISECNYQVLPPLPGKEPVCVSRRPAELTFAVEHLGLGTPKTRKIITFIQNLLEEVGPDSPLQAAILTSKDPIAHHALSRHVNTIQLLEQRLGDLVFPDLGQLLRRARRVLTKGGRAYDHQKPESKNPRPQDVQKVLVVFLDDTVHLSKKALAAARALRDSKVDTYVVYVEEEEKEEDGMRKGGLEMERVEEVASGRDHVIRIPGYDQLRHQETVVEALRTVCRGL